MAAKITKSSKAVVKAPKHVTKTTKAVLPQPRKQTRPEQPQAQTKPSVTSIEFTPQEPEGVVQHVPGQTEIPAVTPEVKAQQDAELHREIPAEGNNIAKVRDRAFADTHPANFQPPVEKTFVSPPDV